MFSSLSNIEDIVALVKQQTACLMSWIPSSYKVCYWTPNERQKYTREMRCCYRILVLPMYKEPTKHSLRRIHKCKYLKSAFSVSSNFSNCMFSIEESHQPSAVTNSQQMYWYWLHSLLRSSLTDFPKPKILMLRFLHFMIFTVNRIFYRTCYMFFTTNCIFRPGEGNWTNSVNMFYSP